MCPCCGQPIPENATVVVSLDNNTIAAHGQCVRLRPRQAELAYMLVKRMPAIVPRGVLVERIWGLNETEATGKSINVHISQLRHRIRPLGLKIETAWGRGFRLRDAQIKQATA